MTSENAKKLLLAMGQVGAPASGFDLAKAAGLSVPDAKEALYELVLKGKASADDPPPAIGGIVAGARGPWNN